MRNLEMSVNGGILTIKVDLTQELGPSSTGKSIIVASTDGNIDVPGHEGMKVGVNVYKSSGKKASK